VSDQRAYDDGQLPWLAAVEDEDEPRGVSARKMLAALIVVLLAAMLVAATFFWLGSRDAAGNGPPELIKAEPGPYKIKPPNPGGLDVAGDSETAFETSAGQDTDGKLDMSKVAAETATAPAPAPAAPAKTAEPAAAKTPDAAAPPAQPKTPPAPKATGGPGSVVQLGAFQNMAQAERAWTALSSRFSSVAALSKMITPYPGGIRLRAGAASPADAKQVCQTLKAAGENCFIAQ